MSIRRTQYGFSLVELIVVIAIIGILVTVGIATYNNVIEDSRKRRAEADLADIKKAIETARVRSQKKFGQITGNYCSFCNACTTGDLRNVPDTHTCAVRWNNVLTTVTAEGYGDITGYKRDPWGSPYVVDENDGEYAATPCRRDWLRSVGPDGVYGNGDDIIIYMTMIHPGC